MTAHRKWRIAATLCLSVLLVPAAGSAAGAVTGPSPHRPERAPAGCPVGDLCAYGGANYTGQVTRLRGDIRDLQHTRSLDHVESLYNHGRSEVTVWDQKDFKGHAVTLAPEHGERNLPHNFGHRVVSQKWGKAAKG